MGGEMQAIRAGARPRLKPLVDPGLGLSAHKVLTELRRDNSIGQKFLCELSWARRFRTLRQPASMQNMLSIPAKSVQILQRLQMLCSEQSPRKARYLHG